MAPAAVAAPNIRANYEWVWFGTFPDTSAGYSDCATLGEYDVVHFPTQFEAWQCSLNDPDSGVYNKWMLENEDYV